jgi:hypothetical protein
MVFLGFVQLHLLAEVFFPMVLTKQRRRFHHLQHQLMAVGELQQLPPQD